jgi:hypothetical protein
VHNTTAEIYKQGSVTTYRMPQNWGLLQEVVTFAGRDGSITGKRVRAPPSTVAQANLLKGTRTWEAKDGVYATLFQSTVANALTQMSTECVLFEPNADPGQAATTVFTPVSQYGAALLACPMAIQASKTMPFDSTGAFFTGLSPQTTLTLKVRYYVERAPTWSDPQLAVLASPSAGYDIMALQLYAQAINLLPPAVMVGENAKGDWWRAVVSVLKHVAGPVGALANPFLPGAGLLGAAISAVSSQIDTSRSVSSQAAAQAKKTKPRLLPAAPPQTSPPTTRNRKGSGQARNSKKK